MLNLHLVASVVSAFRRTVIILEMSCCGRGLNSLLCVALLSVTLSAQSPEPKTVWSFTTDEDGPMRQSWATGGNCFTYSTAAAVHVIARDGKPLWQWNFHRTNRLISIETLAVSPSCDAIAVGGRSDYRYVWIAKQSGAARFFRTTGTPAWVQFSNDGAVVAVTTAAQGWENAYVLSLNAEPSWRGNVRSAPIRFPSPLWQEGNASGRMFSLADLARVGEWPWLSHGGASYSADGGSLVSWGVASHGPEQGWVAFATFPKERWFKAVACPNAIIVPNGKFIIVSGELKASEFAEDRDLCEKFAISIIDRDGNVTGSWPGPQGQFEGVLNDRAFLYRAFLDQQRVELRRYDLEGHEEWALSLVAQATISLSPDRRLLFVREGTRLRLLVP